MLIQRSISVRLNLSYSSGEVPRPGVAYNNSSGLARERATSCLTFFAGSVETIFKILRAPILGVILFLTGAQLALGSCDFGKGKNDRFVSLITALSSMPKTASYCL